MATTNRPEAFSRRRFCFSSPVASASWAAFVAAWTIAQPYLNGNQEKPKAQARASQTSQKERGGRRQRRKEKPAWDASRGAEENQREVPSKTYVEAGSLIWAALLGIIKIVLGVGLLKMASSARTGNARDCRAKHFDTLASRLTT